MKHFEGIQGGNIRQARGLRATGKKIATDCSRDPPRLQGGLSFGEGGRELGIFAEAQSSTNFGN